MVLRLVTADTQHISVHGFVHPISSDLDSEAINHFQTVMAAQASFRGKKIMEFAITWLLSNEQAWEERGIIYYEAA